MEWYGSDFDIYPCSFPVRIYLSNTDRIDFGDEIPANEMTLVYEGTLSFENAEQTSLPVEFTQPFMYDGRNLAVRIERNGDDPDYRGVLGGLGVFYPQGEQSELYPSLYNDGLFRLIESRFKPVVSIFMDATGNSVSGIVTDTEGNALEGVNVTIEENGMNTTTGENGEYKFDLVNEGTYHFVYSLHGYDVVTDEVAVSGEEDTPVTHNVKLEKMKQCTLTVTVTNGKDAVDGAEVSLDGYDPRTSVTGADGKAVFENLICSDYTVTISATDFISQQNELQLSGENAEETQAYALLPVAYSVDGFSLEEAESPVLTWGEPVRVNERRYDDGVATTRAGRTPSDDEPNVENAVFGIVEETPGTIKSVSWYLVESEGKRQRNVNLLVFGLNDDGTPESTPQLVISDIESTVNEWFSYTLDEPFSTSESFYIALACPDDYLGLGVDGSYFNATEEYPYRQMLQYYANDYTETFYIADIWYKGNFMIRLNMADATMSTAS